MLWQDPCSAVSILSGDQKLIPVPRPDLNLGSCPARGGCCIYGPADLSICIAAATCRFSILPGPPNNIAGRCGAGSYGGTVEIETRSGYEESVECQCVASITDVVV